MAIVNRKVSVKAKSKKLSLAIEEARYNSKYFEDKDKLLKSISFKRDLNKNPYL
ncbi:MAG: hypothetical protein ACTSQL_04430 [Promethearchaeota archaeon]